MVVMKHLGAFLAMTASAVVAQDSFSAQDTFGDILPQETIQRIEDMPPPRELMSVEEVDAYCADIPKCDLRPRDIIFMVDASNSMDPDKFYGEMLDFTKKMFCAFDASLPNKVGLMVFSKDIYMRVEFKAHTHAEWFALVDEVKSDSSACCSCCTPQAEAFQLAASEFSTKSTNITPEHLRIGFMITDGVPKQQKDDTLWSQKFYHRTHYTYTIVPEQANLLKATDTRLMLVGVPNAKNKSPNAALFNGTQVGELQCLEDQHKVEQCVTPESPPFPIVSTPVERNTFTTDSWDLDSLLVRSLDMLCLAPTTAPTQSPTMLPTASPIAGAPTTSPTIEVKHCDSGGRDLLFVIDASGSMDEANFRTLMLDVAEILYKTLDPTTDSQVGLVLFSYAAVATIPLAQYTESQWTTMINEIRTDKDSCCSCCTPTAEAFDMALEQFNTRGLNENENVAIVVTDGEPYQLSKHSPYRSGQMSKHYYLARQVPISAQGLKEKARLILAAVPNKKGQTPGEEYFRVGSNNGKICNNGKCLQDLEDYFPIVSEPVDENIFSANDWNVNQLIAKAYEKLCWRSTDSPTDSPTQSPITTAPTDSPTVPQPTTSPTTADPTSSPVQTSEPTKNPTLSPSPYPTGSPTREGETEAPTTTKTEAPKPQTEAPKPQTEAPKSQTEAPKSDSTSQPTGSVPTPESSDPPTGSAGSVEPTVSPTESNNAEEIIPTDAPTVLEERVFGDRNSTQSPSAANSASPVFSLVLGCLAYPFYLLRP